MRILFSTPMLLGIFTTASALSIPLGLGDELLHLFDRASTVCPTNANLTQCGHGLPTNFCCDLSATTCVVFDNGAGSICCPRNSDGTPGNCDTMSPINGGCDPDAYNATLFPSSPIHLKNIPTNFTTCGSEDGVCCPPTYSCTGGLCVAPVADTASSSGASTPTTPVTLSSANPYATHTSSVAPHTSTVASTNAAASTSNSLPPTAIIVGLVPGIVAGALLTFLVIVCIGRRRSHRDKQLADDSSDLGPIRAHVSDPIYYDAAGRTDFLRRNTRSHGGHSSTQPSQRSPTLSRVRSLFSRSAVSTPSPKGLGVHVGTPRTPKTPTRSIRREPSMESITIFSPPDMRNDHRATTYSDVLRAAGAGSHQEPLPMPMPMAYMGSPGMVDPRSRGVDSGELRR